LVAEGIAGTNLRPASATTTPEQGAAGTAEPCSGS
jgi:hypothetical protein